MAEKLAAFIAEYGAGKKARYDEFEVLLGDALRAAAEAVAGFSPEPGAVRGHGLVWVRLEDGRSSFAWFVRERHADTWKRGSRQMGNYLPAPSAYLDEAMVWAQAVHRVFSAKGVEVSVGSKVISDADEAFRAQTRR